jgi:photosystem II stability/assembly factor-like uncharacterized protein
MHTQRFSITSHPSASSDANVKSPKNQWLDALPWRAGVLIGLFCFLGLLLLLNRTGSRFLLVNFERLAEPRGIANLMSENSRHSEWELIHRDRFAHAAGIDSVFFNDSGNGWALTYATLFKLSDQGKTWTPVLTNEESVRAYYGVSFASVNVGTVVGAQKLGDLFTVLILQTSDGGKTWEERPVDVPGDTEIKKGPELFSVTFCGEKSGWAVGRDLILHTSDGGYSWQSQKFDVEGKDRLLTVSCVSPERAWAAGREGLLLQTNDGGQTWSQQDVGTKATLTAIRFFGNDGWILSGGSEKGLLIKTSDQGKTWHSQQLEVSEGFYDIFFLGSQGWLAGDNGTLLRTTDAGRTWSRQPTPTDESLTSLFFLSPNEGWVGGEKLTLLRLAK